MSHLVLTDADIGPHLTMLDAIAAVERALHEHAAGHLVAPPRHGVGNAAGALVFTAGVAPGDQVMGFRVYNTVYPGFSDPAQLTAVYHAQTGELWGVIIGPRIGEVRTGALGGLAIRSMARADAAVLGVLGSGVQARAQVEAALAVHSFRRIYVYSRTPEKRAAFAAALRRQTHLSVDVAASAEAVVRAADVLICATDSTTPVFDPTWLAPGVHINTVGPKFLDAYEVDRDVAARAGLIVTDSIAQAHAMPRPFFLVDTPDMARLVDLSRLVAGQHPGRTDADEITLYCSVGLAATEVVVAAAVLRRMAAADQPARAEQLAPFV